MPTPDPGAKVELQLLGQVALWNADRHVPLGTPRQRCVLAVLAMTPGQPVPLDSLVDRVWGEQQPHRVRNVLYSYVSRLRRALQEAGGESGTGAAVRQAGGGYVFDVPPERIDLHRARQLVSETRRRTGDPAPGRAPGAADVDESRARLRTAYELLSRPPLAGLAGAWVDRCRTAIGQEWLAVAVELFDVEVGLGRGATVASELAELVAEHPLSEPLAGLLMRALYQAGRQADALAVYTRMRRRLVAEIGDEPGPELRRLHERVLRRDLEPGRMATASADGLAPGHDVLPDAPMQLPLEPPEFVGREAPLTLLDQMTAKASGQVLLAAIEGPAGVGKTALAVRWGRRARRLFAGGQLFVDLRGSGAASPLAVADVLARFLRALGVPPGQVPTDPDEAAAAYRSVVADKRLLVVLDNAADSAQVRPLLPSGPGSVVLVTSRSMLAGLVARDGARRIFLPGLSPAESVALLAALLGAERADAGPGAVRELAHRCAGLPLTLRTAAATISAAPPPGGPGQPGPVGSWCPGNDGVTSS